MKHIFSISLISLFFLISISFQTKAQISNQPLKMPEIGYPWKKSELLEPSVLAGVMQSGKEEIAILNIGAVEDLPGALHIGAVSDERNMTKLRQLLTNLPKHKPVVIYCGCCPFTKCPNIQPAYQELSKNGFTQIKVLDLPTNLQTNWISRGYPIAKKQTNK
ncbi:rhodanese-like domain-containing protein [Mucilaginibacter gossypii]|uniref:rhodanese-like domain-containing protein n=1 Tax=Mucilaginibacter gossypii TaxID=551996 RepID=UPI000DCD5598|nr:MULTISPECIES: rhodanese-like domain-containing protein [Mucilaginibacter]QTE40176.1 rhodanese-like domain-containing protein [Mucilaginibacter gossypii]RAV50113.1 rhodanese-like domain-containing protein [Mucilaginibacter rubeus]